MTESLARALAEIDDPATIRDILMTAEGSLQDSNPTSGQATLDKLFERYFNRQQNRSPATRAQYKRTIPEFLQFAEQRDIIYPDQLSSSVVDVFVDTLRDDHDSDATILTYTKNVRAWLKWLHKRQLCAKKTYRILDQEELGLNPKARDEAIPEAEVSDILTNLRQKRYGSKYHALIELCWNAGPRLGGVHSLDLCDFDPEHTELRFRHRPETGTRLKNGNEGDSQPGDGERYIEIADNVLDSINHYIKRHRPDIVDDYGRKPLFATKHGRASKSTLRRWIYRATSCRWASDTDCDTSCDGDCDPDTNVCLCSYNPHAIRRGAIVHHLSGGLRHDRASERFDVSIQILKKHYDPRTKRQRKENRAEAVRDAW
jgi:site-specific recombinase XerD